MNKSLKLVGLFMMSLMLVGILSGCSKEEEELLAAIEKTSKVSYLESRSNVTFGMDAKGFFEDKGNDDLDGIAKFLKGFKYYSLNTEEKINRSQDNLKEKSESKLAIDFGGISTKFSMWSDFDLTGQETKFITTIKFPPILGLSFPAPFSGKEYLQMDMKDLKKLEQSEGMDFSYLTASKYLQNFTANYMNTFLSVARSLDSGIRLQNKRTETTGGGEVLQVYEITLDDAKTKEILQKLMMNFLESATFQEWINSGKVPGIEGLGLGNPEGVLKSVEDSLSGINAQKDTSSKLKDEVNAIFEKLKDVKLVGDKGVNLTFKVNREGYLINMAGDLKFILNINQLMNLTANSSQAQIITGSNNSTASVDKELIFQLKFDTESSNFDKNLPIVMPVLGADEKVTLSQMLEYLEKQKAQLNDPGRMDPAIVGWEQMMKEQENKIASYGLVMLKVNGNLVAFTQPDIIDEKMQAAFSDAGIYMEPSSKLIMRNGRLMAPIATILNSMGIQYHWNSKKKEIVCFKGDDEIRFTIGSNIGTVNGQKKKLYVAPEISEDKTYLSIRDICELTGTTLNWNAELKLAEITN